MPYIVDRIEGRMLVIEGPEGIRFDLPSCLAPRGVKEGDVLSIKVSVDKTATAARKKVADDLLDGFFEE